VTNQIRKIEAELPGLKDVTGVWEVADRRFAQGDAAFVADLGVALAMRYGSSADRMWQYRSVFDHLLRLLTTTAGPENVTQALRLIYVAESNDPKLNRYAASLLASGQVAEDVASAFTGLGSPGGNSEDLRACLIHEMVLRGVTVTEIPGIAEWATSQHWNDHPLAWLPLELSDVDECSDLPSYNVIGGSHPLPYGLSESHDTDIAARPGARVPSAIDVTTAARNTAMTKAVANWVEESNGRTEAQAFHLAQTLEPRAVPALLMTLGLGCLDGAGQERSFSVSACSPMRAWRVLFAAASTGGAYNSGCYGAYGRLAAWQSLTGLSGLADDAQYGEVEMRVQDCAWYAFEAVTNWFEQAGWDIGLAAVAPGHRHLAVWPQPIPTETTMPVAHAVQADGKYRNRHPRRVLGLVAVLTAH
jgi:hypothetical protein